MKAEYVDHMGDDLAVVNAARVSFDKVSDWNDTRYPEYWEVGMKVEYLRSEDWGPSKGDTGEIVSFKEEYTGDNRRPAKKYQVFYVKVGSGVFWTTPEDVKLVGGQAKVIRDDDTKLIKYLAKHDHWTPFAHTAIKLRMQAPLPIRTQCFKHKQGFVENEESRRYISTMPNLFIPDDFRAAPTGGAKQGSSGEHNSSTFWKNIYQQRCLAMIDLYEAMIEDGVCTEQARFVLPQGCEVQWIWTGNLYAFANFYLKRTDSHAQKEIRDLAHMVGDIIEPLFPVSWKALVG
jgi:thymidylate synthase (FAD)